MIEGQESIEQMRRSSHRMAASFVCPNQFEKVYFRIFARTQSVPNTGSATSSTIIPAGNPT
jgi:hypothetical protein